MSKFWSYSQYLAQDMASFCLNKATKERYGNGARHACTFHEPSGHGKPLLGFTAMAFGIAASLKILSVTYSIPLTWVALGSPKELGSLGHSQR